MKGYRVSSLTSEGKIPNEVGETHHFSLTLERAEWWAERLPNEDVQYVPSAFHYAMYGYALVAVEAEEVREDRFFPGTDFSGRITEVTEIIRVVRYQKCATRRWWWFRR